MNIKYWSYKLMMNVLPRKLRDKLGGSSVLAPLRNWFFRPQGSPEITGGRIEFCRNVFHFQAPLQIYEGAKRKGIESRLSRLVLRNGKPGGVYFDIGANYGFLTLIMALRASPHGKVYSFEPMEEINAVLAKNIKLNKYDGFVTVINRPVADQEEMPWEIRSGANGLSTSKTVTLDCYVQKERIQNIDLIKIDVDGGDYQVLLGGRGIIERCQPILIVEMTKHQEDIYNYLLETKYPYIYDMKGSVVQPPDWPPNIIASGLALNWDLKLD